MSQIWASQIVLVMVLLLVFEGRNHMNFQKVP